MLSYLIHRRDIY